MSRPFRSPAGKRSLKLRRRRANRHSSNRNGNNLRSDRSRHRNGNNPRSDKSRHRSGSSKHRSRNSKHRNRKRHSSNNSHRSGNSSSPLRVKTITGRRRRCPRNRSVHKARATTVKMATSAARTASDRALSRSA
jgi:hypothetical protein